jgi:nitroreductase
MSTVWLRCRWMDVSEAVQRRKSIRAFLPTPVDDAVISDLLTTAARAPSGGNLQPWRIFVVNGPTMTRFREFLAGREMEPSAYDIYPTIEVARDDKAGRLAQFAKNFDFFGAPAAIFCFIDREMGPPQWSDLGMYLQTFMLLAQEAGLDTCPQEAWAVYEQAVSEFVGAPPELRIFCAVAIGHADWDHPINTLQTDREPLDVFATFV